MTSMSLRPSVGVKTDASQPSTRTGAVVSPWVWMAVTCLILGISGGIRLWREWQFWSLAQESAACPFPLSELPTTMGTWEATNEDAQLDPEVARFAGATDHFVRNYLDRKTGDQATALTLYGSAPLVHLHTPEACYPAAGFQLVQAPVDGEVAVPGVKEPVRYRWAIYKKVVGGVPRFEEVYYTFRHHGDWLPDVSDRWKTFRYHPGLFKVQIAHATSSLSEGPCRSLLTEFVRQIEERLSPAGPGGQAPVAANP